MSLPSGATWVRLLPIITEYSSIFLKQNLQTIPTLLKLECVELGEHVQSSPSLYAGGTQGPGGVGECPGVTAGKRQRGTQAPICLSSPSPMHHDACPPCQVESESGDRPTPWGTLGLLVDLQSQFDPILLTPSIGRISQK